VLTCCRAAL